jgi:hypothetical protein
MYKRCGVDAGAMLAELIHCHIDGFPPKFILLDRRVSRRRS